MEAGAQRLRPAAQPHAARHRSRRATAATTGCSIKPDRHRRDVPHRPQLLEIWPDLVRHATLNLSSEDVLGVLGRKLHPSLKAQVVADAKRRPQGWRVRNRMGGNWVKVYDQASVLRVETTINNPREFLVLRVFTDERGRRERRVVPDEEGRG